MPQRLISSRIPTDAVQGAESYIVIRHPTMGTLKKWQEQFGGDTGDDIGKNLDALEEMFSYIDEWNWVDEKGKLLPLPKDKPGSVELLIVTEIEYLTTVIATGRDGDAQKK